ncbi:FAD:protein FMN transferase [Solimonas sp. K1W22B-7]|nr:FAD:protein FMN transferase [Solimonas sp. K1W22B-7]
MSRPLLIRGLRLQTPSIVRRRFIAMGTEVLVTVASRGRRHDAEAAMLSVRRLIEDFGRDWWAWGPGTLGGINRRLAAGEAASIPLPMQPLFRRAWEIHQQTGGAYEPRIGALVRLWGFDDIVRIRSAPPAAADIAAAHAALCSAPAYDGGGDYGPAPGITWDFGGIAKGWIVDAALELLASHGFGDATVDAGGNLATRGRRHERAWRIGIRDPRSAAEQPGLLATLDAGDEAVNTHGDDQRWFEHRGQRYSHLLDPRSGWPSQGLRALTVVHPDGSWAEAAGAALFVSGPAGWQPLARRLGITQVLVVHEDGRVQATAALAARLQAEPDVRIQWLD